MSTTSRTLLLLSAALFLRYLATIIYNVFFSPLRHIPGPWYAALTALPTRIACGPQRRQVHYCHDMHKRYGPFVRVAPNQVLIADPGAFREVYRIGSPFLKSRFYTFLNPTPPGERPYGLFQETDPVRHQAARKLLANGFSQSYLRSNWEGVVHERTEAVLQRIKGDAASNGGEVDMRKWWPLMSGDVISMLMFGDSFKMIERGQPDEMIADIERNGLGSVLAYTFPLIYQIIRWLPIPSLQKYFKGAPVVAERGKIAVANSKDTIHPRNIFAKVLAEADKDSPLLTDAEIANHAAIILFAGTDTTATTLTYLIWCVLSNPAIQQSLEDEVSTLTAPFSDEQLEKLPVLDAVIKETLRLYSAAPGIMRRITPSGGATLGGYFIPSDTEVASQAWTLHRNPEIFPDPETFDHRRWLSPASMSPEVKASWAPFGAGSRICIGIHLAEMELRLAAAMFFTEFRGARLAAGTTRESMEVENIALVMPKGRKCRVVLSDSA